jgi:hypothetical protein
MDEPDGVLAEELKPVIERIVKESGEDKAKALEMMKRVYQWDIGDKESIYRKKNFPIGALQDQNNEICRHYPLAWMWKQAMMAMLIDEAKVSFRGSYGQKTERHADLGNAFFEAFRVEMGWDEKMTTAYEYGLMFGGAVAGVYVDTLKYFPDKIPALRVFHPWQYDSTRNRTFKDAPEKLLTFYLEKSELKQIHPDLEKQIDALKKPAIRLSFGSGSGLDNKRISAYQDMPTPWGQTTRELGENAVELTELWQRDTTKKRVSRETDTEMARKENDTIIEALATGQGMADSTMWYDRSQFHRDHLAIHKALESDLERMRTKLGSDMFMVDALLEELRLHMAEHERGTHLIDENEEGYIWTYERGWRYSLVANGELLIYDGESPWYTEHNITNPPFVQLLMVPDPLNVWGPSWEYRMCDLNAAASAGMNRIEDIFYSRDEKLVIATDMIEGGVEGITNKSDEPIKVKSGAVHEAVTVLKGAGVEASTFNFLRQQMDILQQAAGIQDPAIGKPGKNVRSAQQLQGLIGQSQSMANQYLRRIMPEIKKLGIMVWQVCVSIGIDQDYLQATIAEIGQGLSIEELQNIENAPFRIEATIKSAEARSIEEKRQAIDSVIPRLMELYHAAEVPAVATKIGEMIAKIYEDEIPGLEQINSEMSMEYQNFMAMMMGAQEQTQGQIPPDMGAEGVSNQELSLA